MSASDILVLAETPRGNLSGMVAELLGAARSLATATGGQVIAVLLSNDGTPFVSGLQGADRIVLVNHPSLAEYSPLPFLAALQAVIQAQTPRAVLIGSTSIGWDIAPLLAARLNAPLALGCQQISIQDGQLAATCSLCGGKMLAEVRIQQAPAILMVLPGNFAPANTPGKAHLETFSPPVELSGGDSAGVVFRQWILPPPGDIDITTQTILVGVGRGIQQKENLEPIQQLAEILGGAVCASRPIVDQGWLPTTRQVGKSGMTVKPKLYLALGISGAPEHVEGMSGSDLIIAVNTDPKAPIFDIADYGVQMDLMDLVEPLTQAIQAKKAR
ncbi:MAG: electron transfer flavoprotein subunit alpha/FixB family protein [Thermoguttaceae bacterium]|nr:electron transfer flavoprotein subunit alpha/FixB family protein [Thermoguttaceae bacterium]